MAPAIGHGKAWGKNTLDRRDCSGHFECNGDFSTIVSKRDAYGSKLRRFHAKQTVCLAHRTNHMQLRAGLFAEYLQHAHHSEEEVSRSNNDAHITSRDYGREPFHLP